MKFLELGRHKKNQSYSIGIIGGADGPTALYCSDSVWTKLQKILEKVAVAAAALAFVGGVILCIRRKKNRG